MDSAVNSQIVVSGENRVALAVVRGMLVKKRLFHYGEHYTYTIRRAEYLHELTTVPGSKHDDQADSTSQALDWVKTRPTYPLIKKYDLRMALELGHPITERMLKEFDAEQEPVRCPQCNSAPTQYGRDCRCENCGHRWELPDPFKVETRYCFLPDGRQLFWDRYRQLWFHPRSGETFPPGPE